MAEDLILMERLEPRENKDIITIKICLGTCLIFAGITVGLDEIQAIKWLAEHDSGRNVTIPVCGSCSIQ